jgi:ABC-type multidrug transport system ATPase subunit/ABC-type multidrug transport system permease subunit
MVFQHCIPIFDAFDFHFLLSSFFFCDAGKSSLLKALAQLLPPNELKGEILYGNEQPSGLIEKSIYPGHLVQYVEQLDQHLPYLTVRETLEFIHQNSLADPAEFGYVDMAQAHKDRGSYTFCSYCLSLFIISMLDLLLIAVKDTLTMLQLNNCADTLIGNELLRGISGGEKKRVTVGEGLLTNARVLLMDEISTGLDAAVTFDICHSLRQRVTSTHLSAVIALLQPTPEVYALFDEVILMREGQVMYHGPRVELPAYLRQLGFEVPEDVRDEKSESKDADMADFLSELVFTPFKALPKVDDVLKPVPPLDTEGLVYAWKHSALYEAQMNSQPDSPIVLETAFQEAQYGKEYVHDPMHHSKLLLLRQLTLMTRNKLSVVFRLMSSLLLSVLYGGLYYQKTIAEGLPRYGLFMNCLMYLAMGNMSEMPPAVDFKYVAYKHTANNAHPKFAYVLAAQAAHLCVSIVNVILYTSVIYWMAGLTPYASNFFIFMLCGFLSDQMMGALSRAAAYAAATTQAASTFLLPFISLMIIFMGYLLPRGHMGWTIIFFYINPFAWLFRALAINEFVSPPFEIRPGGPNTATLGTLYLNTFDIENDSQWIWWGILHACVAVVLAIWLAFRMFATVRHDRNIGSARRLIPIDEDVLKELEVRKSNRGVVENPKAEPENQLSNINAGAAAPIEMAAMSKITQSVLHFQPMSIVFQDMKYTVELPENKGSKVLLQGISGYASPGRMLALMGASGAGKTTLLDVLSSRKNSGKMEGRILLNGFEKEEDSFSRITSYVEQQDIHMPEPTVREALQFSAALRLPPEVTVVQREAFIEEVLDLLELRPIQNRAIGDAGAADGLAPGERKRLTIAVELVSNAPVIFADEPTSGLDARSAQVVVRTLRNVAATGRTVICTIHQPSAELFFMFDDLLLLQKGGFMAYFGPMGERACQLVEYLQKLEGAKPCPSDFNPASWMLDQLAGTDSSIGADEQKHQQAAQPAPVESEKQPAADGSQNAAAASAAPAPVMGIPGEYLQSTLFASALWAEQSAQLQKLSQPLPGSQPVRFAGKQARTWLEQYLLLCERVQTAYIRNLGFNYGRVVSLLVLFLLFGTVYANLQVTDLSGVTSLVCVIFMTCQFAYVSLPLPVFFLFQFICVGNCFAVS